MAPITLNEINAIKKDGRKVDILFGYCYPSTYRAGMTSLATHLFYSLLNGRKDTSCERYFRFDVLSPFRSIETGRPLKDNHIIGFSLSYEEDILNIVQMLQQSEIPILAAKRDENDPIVIMGGPVPSSNPEPYVDFIDAFVIGEGDSVIHDIVDCAKISSSRFESIEKLAQLRGVYVPGANPSIVNRLVVDNLDSAFHPIAQIIPDVSSGSKHEPVFGKSFLVEVSRGCGHSCKFCLIGHICRPRRVRTFNNLTEIIKNGLRQTPVQKVSLIGSSLGDTNQLEELASWIVGLGHELSVPSLRADSVTGELLRCLVSGGQRTLTIAPETGSSSLRKEIGKGMTDSDIENAANCAAESGYKALKLYFIVGLPGESDGDVMAIAEMTRRIAEMTRLRVTASVNAFVPKAQTRWERQPQLPIEALREKFKAIRKALRNTPQVNMEILDPRHSRVQASLSLGGRDLGSVIRDASFHGGLGGWRRAEKKAGIQFFAIANDAQRLDGALPWDFIKR